MIRVALLPLVFLALLNVSLSPPVSAGQMFGTVRTLQGQPLGGARVTVVNADESAFFERRSDGAGAFSFPSIPPGTWTIGASKVGFAYRDTVRVVGASSLQQDFELGPDVHPGRWSVIGNTHPENLFATNSGSLLPDGTILYCHDTEEPVRFDPVTGAKSFPPSSPSQQGCHATTLLLDGRLVFVGGQDSGDFRDAVRTVKTFNYQNEGWLVLQEMNEERWYPGLARLADGRLLAMGGGQRPNAQRTPTCEVFDPEANEWTPVDPMSNPSDYPPAVLLYSGQVLRSWWPPQLYDVEDDVWTDTGTMVQTNRLWPGHCDHSLVLLPDGRACAIGIYRTNLVSPSMIELYDADSRTWTLGMNAEVTRSQPEVVMLPTGQVFVAGGKLEDPNPSVPTNEWGQVRLTDLYDPVADAWRRCADMAWFREYHALSVLVPDGRVVVTAGTGGPAQPGVSDDIEAFEPPYLFRGVRPRIDAISTTELMNGSVVTLNVSRTDAVTDIVLTGTDAVTHWVNGGVPRVLRLEFEQSMGEVAATIPADPRLAPAGYYILFAMVDDIPSEGIVVHVGQSPVQVPDDTPPARLIARASPNPFRTQTHIVWYQPTSGWADVTVMDAQGRSVRVMGRSYRHMGWQHFEWEPAAGVGGASESGVHWIRLRTNTGTKALKLIRLK